MKVSWRPAARADVARITAYLASLNPAAARHVLGALTRTGDSLAVFPHRGRVGLGPNLRELVAVWPYVIVYRIGRGDEVTILRVWHAAQDRR